MAPVAFPLGGPFWRGDLPNVNLGAAATHGADTGVGVVGGRLPAFDVGLATHELEITGTLGIAVLVGESSQPPAAVHATLDGRVKESKLTPVPYLAPASLLG